MSQWTPAADDDDDEWCCRCLRQGLVPARHVHRFSSRMCRQAAVQTPSVHSSHIELYALVISSQWHIITRACWQRIASDPPINNNSGSDADADITHQLQWCVCSHAPISCLYGPICHCGLWASNPFAPNPNPNPSQTPKPIRLPADVKASNQAQPSAVLSNDNNKLYGRPPQYDPAPCKLTFWPWKWCPSHVCQF